MTDHIRLHDLSFAPAIPAESIGGRVSELARQLRGRFRENQGTHAPLFVAVLRGAAVFHADLIRAYDGDLEVGFVRTRSYIGTASSGDVDVDIADDLPLRGRDVVLVEDIADSGRTLQVLAEALRERSVASLTTVVLLDKPTERVVEVEVDFVGFTIGPDFVVGYGLDYDGLGRNLPSIYTRV